MKRYKVIVGQWIGTAILLLNILDASYCGSDGHKHIHSIKHHELTPESTLDDLVSSRWSGPYFDHSIPRSITALAGKSAYLSCRVMNLGNKSVSFVRHRDLHILTVGAYTYTSDQRFTATYHRQTNEWTLQIKFVQKRDAGAYECQVSTQPVKSFSIDLHIVVPTATILGGHEDFYVDKGSSINLTCLIRFCPEPPVYIFWYHDDHVLSSNVNNGIRVQTEHRNDAAISYLLIKKADYSYSGKYTCDPSNANAESVTVRVLSGCRGQVFSIAICLLTIAIYILGERPEAMYTTGSSNIYKTNLFILLTILYMYEYLIPFFQINWYFRECFRHKQLINHKQKVFQLMSTAKHVKENNVSCNESKSKIPLLVLLYDKGWFLNIR